MNRIELINFLIERFNYKKYLEVGCAYDECFSKISCPDKTGVDPIRGGNFRGTSDHFFECNKETFDIIFVDGLHHCDQVIKDIENSIKVLNGNGVIVVHDCNPLNENEQVTPQGMQDLWCGDVWKAIFSLRNKKDIDIAVGDFDYGCGVIKIRENSNKIDMCESPDELRWEHLDRNRAEGLNLMSEEDLKKWV